MTSQLFFDNINLILDKSQTGQLPPEEIFPMANMAQQEVFGNYKRMMIETDFVHDALNPFRTSSTFTAADFASPGLLTLPSACEHVTGLMLVVYNNELGRSDYEELKLYKADEVPVALKSQVRPPSVVKPVTTREGVRSIRFFPATTYAGTCFYLRKPADMVYNYTMNGRQYVYNPVGSVAPEWADSYVNEVFYKTLEMLAVILNDSSIAQYAMATQKTNQQPVQ